MMPNILGLPGRQYDGGQASTDVSTDIIRGHEDVVALWNDYTSPDHREFGWSFYKRAIRLAVRFFVSDEVWFKQMERNASIHGYNYEFILDTLRFIATGKRNISIHMWSELVSHVYDGNVEVDKRHTISNYMKANAVSFRSRDVGMIQQWVAQPNGIDDLIATLNILFGDLPVRG